MRNRQINRWLVLAVMTGIFIVLIANAEWWETALRFFFPDESNVLHARSLLVLAGDVLHHSTRTCAASQGEACPPAQKDKPRPGSPILTARTVFRFNNGPFHSGGSVGASAAPIG